MGKAHSPKSESLALRIDPKLKYGLELLSRKQKRSITSLIESLVQQALEDRNNGLLDLEVEKYIELEGYERSFNIDTYWSPYEWERISKLNQYKQEWMTFEERHIWSFVFKNACYWNLYTNFFEEIGENIYGWGYLEDRQNESPLFERVEEDWPILKKISEGHASVHDLPFWIEGQRQRIFGFYRPFHLKDSALTSAQKKCLVINDYDPLNRKYKEEKKQNNNLVESRIKKSISKYLNSNVEVDELYSIIAAQLKV